MTPPIVLYLETNWLVSCVLPYHPWRSAARSLMDAAETGLCELRIPEIAFLEAPHVVERETKRHTDAITAAADNLKFVGRNLVREDLFTLANELIGAEASYRRLNPRKELDDLITRCSRFRILDLVAERKLLDELRSSTMRGPDIVDAYILSCIANHRQQNPNGPAAFLSTNSKEFAVDKQESKLPRNFYSSRKLVYHDKFDVEAAKRAWSRNDLSGWRQPMPHQADPRRREVQKLVTKLSEDSLDRALKALRALSESR